MSQIIFKVLSIRLFDSVAAQNSITLISVPLNGMILRTITSVPFDLNITKPLLVSFVDAAHENYFCKRLSTTGFFYMFCGGTIFYKTKTQSLNAGSSTKAGFIAAHTSAKIAHYLCMVLKYLGYEKN